MRVEVAGTGFVLAEDAVSAATAARRLRGLLGSRSLQEGRGLVLEPASQVHTFGMKYPIDVVFCDASGVVKHVVRAMPPMRMTRWVRGSRKVVELPADTVPPDLHPGARLLFYEDGVKGQ